MYVVIALSCWRLLINELKDYLLNVLLEPTLVWTSFKDESAKVEWLDELLSDHGPDCLAKLGVNDPVAIFYRVWSEDRHKHVTKNPASLYNNPRNRSQANRVLEHP